jgi:hypothetical protein
LGSDANTEAPWTVPLAPLASAASWPINLANFQDKQISEPAAKHPPRALPNDPGDRDHTHGATHTLKQVQAAVNNPLSSLWSLQLQNKWTLKRGTPSKRHYKTDYTGLFQPAMPVPLTENWTWISRPILEWASTPDFDATTGSWDRESGLGDFTYETWITPTAPSKFQLAGGFVVSTPLTSRDALSSGKTTLGPSMVAIYKHEDWIFGTLAQYQWDISGSDQRPPVSQMSAQYFITWMGLPDHWQLNMSPTITYNNKATGPNAWAVPIGIGVGKMVKIGKVPIKIQFEYNAYLAKPDDFGPRHSFFITFTPVIRALIKKPLF